MRKQAFTVVVIIGLMLGAPASAQNTSSIPMGTFSGAASGTLDNGVEWTVDKGSWHPFQGYVITPAQSPQTWTFSPEATLRFGIAGINGNGECVRVPEGSIVESIHPNHQWNEANRLVCKLSGNQNDPAVQAAASVFVLITPQTALVLEAVNTNGWGRGPSFIEVTVPTAPADLRIVKTVDPASAVVGGNVSYTLVVSNNGAAAADGAIVTDPGAPELDCTTLSCSAADGAVCPSSPTPAQLAAGLVIPTLPTDGSVTLTLGCTLTAGP